MPLFDRLKARIVDRLKNLSIFDGYKTYIAGAGLFGLALFQLSSGHFEEAAQSFAAALAAVGLRSAIAKQAKPNDPPMEDLLVSTTWPPKPPVEIKQFPEPPVTTLAGQDTAEYPITPIKMGAVLLAVLVLSGSAMACDPSTRVRVALALAQAQSACTSPEGCELANAETPVALPSGYVEARASALAQGKPLIVWVGQPPREISGAIGVAVERFPDVTGKGVVIGKPDAGDLMRFRTLTGEQTASQVRSELDCPDGKCNLPSATGAAGNAAIAAYEYCPTCPGGVRRVR